MDEQTQKLRVGIYTIIVLLILAIVIFLFSDGWGRKYDVYLHPQKAPGVRVGTPVRRNGLLIGRVNSVQTQDDHVILRMSIDEREKLYANETASIGAESIIGDTGIEIIPLPAEVRGDLIRNNERLHTVAIKPNPMEMVNRLLDLGENVDRTLNTVQEASKAVALAGEGVELLSHNINHAFADEDSELKQLVRDIRQLSDKAEAAVENVDRIFSRVANFLEDPKVQEDFNSFVESLPPIFQELRVAIEDAGKIVNSFGNVSVKASENLDNLLPLTKAIGEQGPEIVTSVSEGIGDIREVIQEAKGFSENLKGLGEIFGNKDGTVGKLFSSTELYDEVLVSVKNVREFSETMKQLDYKLKPIINDVRHFTDAISRDPGILGVRGALDRRPGKTGYKGTPGGNRSLFR